MSELSTGLYWSPTATEEVTQQAHVIEYNCEYETRPEFGSHKACETCNENFRCMTGDLPDVFTVAVRKQDHIDGISLPCIHEGRVRLKVVRLVGVLNPEVTTNTKHVFIGSGVAATPTWTTSADSYVWSDTNSTITIVNPTDGTAGGNNGAK